MGDHYEPTEIVDKNTISNDTTVEETVNKQNGSDNTIIDEANVTIAEVNTVVADNKQNSSKTVGEDEKK